MKHCLYLFLLMVAQSFGAIVQLDTENADRDLTSIVTVLTDTPDASDIMLCQGLILFGDGAKNLDGTGGSFELTITVGGQTVQPSPQTITFSTAVRSSVWTSQFPVPANTEVILRAKSPNGADTDVDVTAYLYDVHAPVRIIDGTGTGEIDTLSGSIVNVDLVDTTTTLTGHTNQTGDTYALANNGTYGFSALEALVDDLESRLTAARAAYLDKLNVSGTLAHSNAASTYKADVSGLATSGAQSTAQNDLDILTGTDGATLATSQGNYAPAKAGDLMGLANDAVTAAKITDAAWQELIELLFNFDATATYATANAGSVVRQIATNAVATIPPRIE